uniref:ceramide kinase isoform X3 n=1 Tax=Pristiophorus japonicus TaxID=55135 RepID=UPI00398EB493
MEQPPPLMVSHLLADNQLFEVTLTESVLSWQSLRPRKLLSAAGAGSYSVPVVEIVAVCETEVDAINKESGRWQKMPSFSTELILHAFTVSYVQRSKGHHWWCNEVTFNCNDHLLRNQWVQALKEQLELQAMRPKHLIVFINPFGGKRRGKQIYDDKVAPLFRLACISAEVIGSTDCICYATVGVNDPVTSALHIIIGDSQAIDVSSVHHKNMFLMYSVSLLGYGFYGDTLMDSEKNRWMGPSRYDFSGFKTFLSHHCYEGTISYLPATETLGNPRDQAPCTAGCHICQYSGEQLKLTKKRKFKCIDDEEQQQWKVIKGKFLAINSANMSCACPKSPKGLSPAAHLADGTIDLILVRKCSRFSFLRHLIRHTNNDDQFDLAFVEVYRVKKFKFTPKYCDEKDTDIQDVGKNVFGQFCRDHPTCSCAQLYSNWNCDGELIEHAAIEVRVHCQLLRLFVRGIEELSTQKEIGNSFVV